MGGDGPLKITGPVRILTEAGDLLRETDRVTLCRCGTTANPPFCDGSHDRIGFRSATLYLAVGRFAGQNMGVRQPVPPRVP